LQRSAIAGLRRRSRLVRSRGPPPARPLFLHARSLKRLVPRPALPRASAPRTAPLHGDVAGLVDGGSRAVRRRLCEAGDSRQVRAVVGGVWAATRAERLTDREHSPSAVSLSPARSGALCQRSSTRSTLKAEAIMLSRFSTRYAAFPHVVRTAVLTATSSPALARSLCGASDVCPAAQHDASSHRTCHQRDRNHVDLRPSERDGIVGRLRDAHQGHAGARAVRRRAPRRASTRSRERNSLAVAHHASVWRPTSSICLSRRSATRRPRRAW